MKRTADFYQEHFQRYHERTFSIDPASFLAPLIRHLKPGAGILDVGCGSGRDLKWLKDRGFEVTGFERSKGLAALARANASCTVIEGDFEAHDFSKLKFDAMLMLGSLVHVPHERLGMVFGNIVKGLRDGGKVMVSLKQGEGSSTDEDGRMFYLWQDIELRNVFAKHAFRVLDCHESVSKVNATDTWLSYVLQ